MLQLLACLARDQLLEACSRKSPTRSSRESLFFLHTLGHFFTLSHSLPLQESHLNIGLLIAEIQANLARNKANKMVDKIQPYRDYSNIRVLHKVFEKTHFRVSKFGTLPSNTFLFLRFHIFSQSIASTKRNSSPLQLSSLLLSLFHVAFLGYLSMRNLFLWHFATSNKASQILLDLCTLQKSIVDTKPKSCCLFPCIFSQVKIHFFISWFHPLFSLSPQKDSQAKTIKFFVILYIYKTLFLFPFVKGIH